ncbi:CLUMA_CG012794, isoform A [Clunio marinus]|uniref:CLUMA_CG012794, isoform A n=1 Tax=Clunio marinus TaxID=568069 RepID=A0A1J1IG31_9DIPT|nr:CLUMA_CG012794, isoform A [Clunio marinus]
MIQKLSVLCPTPFGLKFKTKLNAKVRLVLVKKHTSFLSPTSFMTFKSSNQLCLTYFYQDIANSSQ